LEEAFAGDAALRLAISKTRRNWRSSRPYDVTKLLLFIQADRVFGEFATELRAVLARRIAATFESLAGAKDAGRSGG
jgi:hypothetical protein